MHDLRASCGVHLASTRRHEAAEGYPERKAGTERTEMYISDTLLQVPEKKADSDGGWWVVVGGWQFKIYKGVYGGATFAFRITKGL